MENMEKLMSQSDDSVQDSAKKVTGTDFSFQFSAAREFQKVEKKIFNILSSISKKQAQKSAKKGILVVFGVFDSSKDYIVPGMRQIGINPIQKYLNISNPLFDKEVLSIFNEGSDGAIIVNRNGQVIGSKVYLIVDNPALEVPEGCGTRHISGASFSTRDDVIAVFTLSEETSIVRKWKDGSFVDQYNPKEDEA